MSKHYKKEPVMRRLGLGREEKITTEAQSTQSKNFGEEREEKRRRRCVVCGIGAMMCVEPPLCEKHLEMVSLICQAERLNARRATLEDVLSMAVLVRGKLTLARREIPNVYRDVMVNYWEKETGNER